MRGRANQTSGSRRKEMPAIPLLPTHRPEQDPVPASGEDNGGEGAALQSFGHALTSSHTPLLPGETISTIPHHLHPTLDFNAALDNDLLP